MRFLTLLLATLSLALTATAHPGEFEPDHNSVERREFLHAARGTIANCHDQMVARGDVHRAVERRAALAEKLRHELGLTRRGARRAVADVLAKDHKSTKTGLTANSPAKDLFTGNLQCLLQAEVTEGPYYVRGELVRKDVRDTQPGVAVYLDYQLIDTTTCKPLPDVYLETWQSNATGVYGGVNAQGNGNAADTSNINKNFLRGLQKTDADGVAQFLTIFPGFYYSRTTHTHIIAQVGATLRANNTLTGGYISHAGQAFFDQKLITEVTKVYPYSSNTQQLLTNAQDSIFAQEANSMDPVYNYVYLGNGPQDGILAWITIGINPNNRRNIMVAADWTANGGVPAAPQFPGWPGFPGTTATPTQTTSRTTTAIPTQSTATTLPTTGPTISKYGQCGGTGWTGGTQCVSGTTCTVVNAWYSQCL